MVLFGIIVTAVVGLVVAVVLAGAGYWFGGRAEQQRRKDSLKDDRLLDVRNAVIDLERRKVNLTVWLTEIAIAMPPGQRVQTKQRISEDYSASASLSAAGAQAAIALGAPEFTATSWNS